jgi:hypothetical protein
MYFLSLTSPCLKQQDNRRLIMSDFFIKEMTDNTITLMTENGYIIGKFDDIEDTSDIFFDELESQEQLAYEAQAST